MTTLPCAASQGIAEPLPGLLRGATGQRSARHAGQTVRSRCASSGVASCIAVRSASSTAASRAALPVNEAVAVEAWGGRPRAGGFASIRLEGVRGEGV